MGKAVLVLGAGFTLLAPLTVHAAFEYDGGRSKILFNNYDKFSAPKTGSSTKTKECPKADELSPFSGIAFAGGDILVRLNESDTAPMCQVLKRIGSAPGNETSVEAEKMIEFSKRCGPVGEYKRRIAESWSIPMYTGGLDWVNSDGEEIWVETDQTGTTSGQTSRLHTGPQGILVKVTKAKWEATKECWTQGCECEQTKSPRLRIGLYVLGAVMFAGLMWDFIRFYVFGIREETEEERKERKEKKKAEKEKKKKDKKERKAREEAEGKNGEGEDEEGAGAKDGEDKEPKSGSSSADGDEVEGDAAKGGEEKKDK